MTTTTTPPPYDPTRYPDLVASATAPTTAVANVAPNIYFHHFQHRAVTTGTSPNFFFQKSDLTYGTVDLPSSTLSAPMLSGQSLTASSPSVSFGENGGQIRVCVDKRSGSDTGAISESNEVNNCSPWTTVTTTTIPPPYDPTRYPDLVASATVRQLR